jgi:hypothetical protein
MECSDVAFVVTSPTNCQVVNRVRLELKVSSHVLLLFNTKRNPHDRAFSIWGPIFVGELVLVTAQLLVGPNDSMAPFLKSASVPFMAANLFQSLWCAAFRPKYKGRWMAVSFASLVSTAFSLSKVHNAALGLIGWDYVIYGLPTSLHFGWVTAASLVNLNGAVAMQKEVSASTVAWVGHLSVVTATVLGILVTVSRQAPVYGGVICWALTAVADGMAKRVMATKNDTDQQKVGVRGAKLQHRLSQIGAILTGGASFAVLVGAVLGGDKRGGSKIAP